MAKASSLSDMDKQSRQQKFRKTLTKKQKKKFEKTLSKPSSAKKKRQPVSKRKESVSPLTAVEKEQRRIQFQRQAKEKRIGVRTINRELRKGKYFVVLRRDGKIQEKARWGKKHLLIDNAFKNLKKNNSIFSEVSRRALVNVFEVQDLRKGTRIPSGMSQFIVEGTLKDGTVITARSLQSERGDKSKAEMRQEALDNFYGKLFQHLNPAAGSGEAEQGFKIFERNMDDIQVRQGFVRYEAIT